MGIEQARTLTTTAHGGVGQPSAAMGPFASSCTPSRRSWWERSLIALNGALDEQARLVERQAREKNLSKTCQFLPSVCATVAKAGAKGGPEPLGSGRARITAKRLFIPPSLIRAYACTKGDLCRERVKNGLAIAPVHSAGPRLNTPKEATRTWAKLRS